MPTLADTTWTEIAEVRDAVKALDDAPTVQAAAQRFTRLLVETYPTVVLARLFLVLPASALPAAEQEVARGLVGDSGVLKPKTRVLSLLGTAGRHPDWNDRARSHGHLAIPLIDRSFVRGAPMIAKLLADLEVDLAGLDSGLPIATRRMVGGSNGTFYVPDAITAIDDRGRYIIPARDFVTRHGVRTVFGMGGAYLDGTLAVAIVFTSELLDRVMVGRFPSFIANFKMATARAQAADALYAA